MNNQFIVRWKNGDVSIINAEDRQDFFDNVLYDNVDDIETAEHDYVFQLDLPEALAGEEENQNNTEILNWGPKKVMAEEVWNQNQYGDGIIVAVIDSGIEPNHLQLSNQLAVNSGEIAGNDIDDDGNGYVDDVNGWDFVDNSPVVSDTVGHGTHVSGIIAAQHGTGDILGMAPQAKILPLNFMNPDGSGTLGHAIAAMDYAVARGARIINASWGGASCSNVLEQAIKDLESQNVLFMVAAGNNGLDLETFPEFPAAYVLPAQITIGASTINDFTSGFSNTSRKLVDLVAPGTDIMSTVPSSDFANTKSGTSMATPFVSGAAALLWGAHPSATAAQVKKALLDSVDTGPFPVFTEGRLNVQKALAALDSVAP